jgi:membrane glycosyltransferase
MHKRKAQGTPDNTKGRVFSSKFVKSNLSFATAVRGQTDPMIHQDTATSSEVPERPIPKQQEPGQPVPASILSSENVDMNKVFTVVQQIMKELNDAVSERDKIFAVTNIVFNLLKQNGQYSS